MNEQILLKVIFYIMKKITSILLLVFLAALQLNAQSLTESDEPTKKPKKDFDIMDKLVIGGSFGAAFGDITFIDISPTVGYLVSDNVLLGIGGKYIYFKDNTPGYKFQTNIYAGSLFGQYFFLENFVAHAEYELMNRGFSRDPSRFELERINVHSVFLGGGYRGSLGGNSFVNLLVLFNLNDSEFSPYTNPQIRAGFGIGF